MKNLMMFISIISFLYFFMLKFKIEILIIKRLNELKIDFWEITKGYYHNNLSSFIYSFCWLSSFMFNRI